jgi:hypothetical protein
VGNGGDILTSPNGLAWYEQSSGIGNDLAGAAWCAGAYFVVGDDGAILGSVDGIDWDLKYLAPGIDLRGIECGEGLLVASGYPGIILTSGNGGDTWVEREVPASVAGLFIYDVSWGNEVFVAAAAARILYSFDGIEWFEAAGSYQQMIASIWNGEYFNVIGNNGKVMRSEDGIDWIDESPPIEAYLRGIASSPSADLAVGEHGAIILRGKGEVFSDSFESGDTLAWSLAVQ